LEKLFRRKFKTYEIHFEDEDLNLTADITKTTESWRPKNRTPLFGTEKSKEFNWLCQYLRESYVSYNYDNK
jgi:hypothetical protein